ncbi:VanZ family protein [candidate division KSB1 bacterium]|nr:VanZ family protein [candidate division KSB1 bacterium]
MNNTSSTDYLKTLMLLLMMYISFLYVYALSPFRFSRFYFFQYLLFRKGYLATLTGPISSLDFLINLVMLIPVGVLIASLFKTRQVSFKRVFFITTVLGFIMSATIEVSQMFLPRVTSAIDILNNTAGTSFGAYLVYSIKSFDPQNFFNKISLLMKRYFFPILLGYSFFITVIFSLPPLFNNFNNWNENYLLLVGNEGTKNRPWEGNIYKLSIFNRLLKQNDIEKYFAEGYSLKTGTGISNGLLLEYLFENLPVQNNGSIKESLILNVQAGSQVKKLPKGNGISIRGNSILQSQKPPVTLIKNLKRTDQISIVVWIKPQHLKMVGPARIVSLSADPGNRNFTLGQTQDRINFRVRTPLTGINGSKVSLTSSPILNSWAPQLIVATFDRGEVKLYFNGKLTGNRVFNTSFYLPLLIRFTKERYRIISFCFTLLFPLGWFVWGFSSDKFWKRLVFTFSVLLPSIFSSLFSLLFFQHSIDLHLILLSCVIFFLVVVGGLFCDLLIILLNRYKLS